MKLLLATFAASVGLANVCQEGADAARRRDLGAAESLLKQCIASGTPPLQAYLLLCGVYQAQQNSEALTQTATAAISRFPEDKRFYLTAATIAGRKQQFAEAIRLLEPALKRWPADEKVRSMLASSYFGRGTGLLDAGDNEQASKNLKRATELTPADVEAQMNLGRALHNLLRHSEALEAFDRVLQLQPQFPLARFHRGLTLYSLGEFDGSVREMNEQIAADSSYAPAYLVRGMARLATGESVEAVRDLEKAAAEMPADANAQMACARALIQVGRYADAEPKLRRAMELDSSNPAPANTLVTVLIRLDRGDEAREVARKARELARQRRTVSEGEIRFEKGSR